MQSPAWLLSAETYLRDLLVSILAQLTIWSDQVYWNGYEPLAKAAILVAAGGAVVLCMLVFTDEDDARVWSRLTAAGRWMGGVAAVAVVAAVWASRSAGA